ncbi:hypothetical protein HU200_028782 [Digitaria exilis]|uniref:DNA polymerase delta subunit 4 n=1 Tax=Digitaria exilis TaxID=1010633 RepID=A0A835EST6_9POAL|nr:hypothetical protein HU200_028782 [Digitaria exilis]
MCVCVRPHADAVGAASHCLPKSHGCRYAPSLATRVAVIFWHSQTPCLAPPLVSTAGAGLEQLHNHHHINRRPHQPVQPVSHHYSKSICSAAAAAFHFHSPWSDSDTTSDQPRRRGRSPGGAMPRGNGGDMKTFFRQQKAHAATKPTGGVSKKASAAAHHHQKAPAPALHVHPLISDPPIGVPSPSFYGATDGSISVRLFLLAEERERAAREFDMDMRYGPCLGITRAQRLRRATALGLATPPGLLALLCTDDQPCLWEGRV